MCEMAKNKSVRCNFSGNNFTCPFRCDEFKRSCNAKCVKLDEGPKERKKKKKPDPNEDLRLMPQIQRVAEIEGCLNQSRFSYHALLRQSKLGRKGIGISFQSI